MRKIQKYNRFFGGQNLLRMTKQTNCHCERSVPQATPTGGPVRDERSEHAISYGLPQAHALAMTESGRSVFPCHPCASGDLTGCLRNRFPVKRGMTGAISFCHSCQAQRERESMPRQARHDTIMLPCHCERSVPQATPTGGPVRDERSEHAISYGLPRAHALAMTEVGRSMVEMLGVLAIMGIVGMVGVKMYTSAMNKHRANELIYEAQKRATMVAMQITAGQENLSVANFTNPTGYTFGVEKNPQNANQFNITINAVDSDVCTQMKTAIGNGSVVRHIDDNCMELTFNNDLSRITEAQCTGSGKYWCHATGYCSDTNDCCLSGNCTIDSCPTGTSTTGTGGSTGIFVGTSECKCASGKVYLGTECITKPTTCSSWTTNECGKGYYCNFANVEKTNGSESCYNITGTCATITAQTQPTLAQKAILQQAGFKSTFLKGPANNWWSGASWCVAQGKHLIDVSQMDCHRKTTDPATNNTVVQADETWAHCCKDGQACQQTSWNTSLWNGKNILAGKEAEVAKFADKMVALRKVYGAKNFWMASPYAQNSCYAFYANEGNGRMDGYLRDGNLTVLCE